MFTLKIITMERPFLGECTFPDGTTSNIIDIFCIYQENDDVMERIVKVFELEDHTFTIHTIRKDASGEDVQTIERYSEETFAMILTCSMMLLDKNPMDLNRTMEKICGPDQRMHFCARKEYAAILKALSK